MTPIRLTVTALTLGAATFLATTLFLDGAPQPPLDAGPTMTAKDRAAFAARVAVGLEDEPHMRGRTPAAEANAGADAQPPAAAANAAADAQPRAPVATDRDAAGEIAAATRIALAAVAPITPAAPSITAAPSAAQPAAIVAARAAPADDTPPRFAISATTSADRIAATAEGWVAASGSLPAIPELRPMPRRR